MREIKFKVWDKENEKWLLLENEFFLLYDEKEQRLRVYDSDGENYSVELTNIEIVEYTGLKDKNGKEIYEGNILSDGEEWTGVVKYKNGGYYLDCGGIYDPWLSVISVAGEIDDFSIIGNIYENPELLKCKDNV